MDETAQLNDHQCPDSRIIQTVLVGGQGMTERSPFMGVALLAAPTVGVIAIRMGIPALEDVLKEDMMAQAVIHVTALLIGIIMYFRYRVVEDHEYHRSSAIKGLQKMYKMEDKGLWEKGDSALERLESQARESPKGKAALKRQKRMAGRISDINKENDELELDEDDERMSIDVDIEGMATIVDSEAMEESESANLSGKISARAEASAQKRLSKELAKRERVAAKQAKKEAKAARKAEKAALKLEKVAAKTKPKPKKGIPAAWDAKEENLWANTPIPSSLSKSVVSCKDCGAVNNAGTSYCTSCGTFL